MMISQIDNKPLAVELFRQGYFGNRMRNWTSVANYLLSDHQGLSVLRSRRVGFPTVYDVERSEFVQVVATQTREGDCQIEDLYVNEAIPSKDVVLNAEAAWADGQPYCFYSTAPDHMKPALYSSGEHAFGYKALSLWREVRESSVEEWLERFPDHIVEFTVCSCPIGDLGWRSIIWEVRRY